MAEAAEPETKCFLNPITLEANSFLKTLEKYSSKAWYQQIDEELLLTMDKLVDAINKFCDKSQTKVEETDNLKLIRVKDTDFMMRSYQCTKCHKFLGPSTEKAARHISSVHPSPIVPPPVPKRKKRSSETSNAASVKLPKKARSLLTAKLGKFQRQAFQTAEKLKQMPEYEIIEDALHLALQRLYPDKKFKLFKFGSRISGVGNADSDLDIFVDMDNNFHIFNERATTEVLDVIKKVSNDLKKDKKWSQVLAIQNARVPIIKLKHNVTKIHCDIGFSNSLGYCNTVLMRYLFELQPIAARMCMFLKQWLERTKLNDNISTYSFTLMVIYYLQISFVLPSIEDLQHDLEEEEFIGPWINNFREKSLKELNLEPVAVTKASFREHLYNFFVFYGEFDYENYVVCPYKGEMIKIEDILDELPQRYADFVKGSGEKVELQLKKAMIVQDPLELSHNVTKGISKSLLKIFVLYFIDSAKTIANSEPEKTKNAENNMEQTDSE